MCDEPRRELYRHMDAANVDLKAFTERFYRKIWRRRAAARARHARLSEARDRRLVRDHDAADPGRERFATRELDALTRWIVDELGPDVPLHFTAFHPDWKMLDTPPTPAATLHARARDRARERPALRLHGQRARSGGRNDALPGLRRGVHRARLVSPARLAARSGRSLRATAARRSPASSRRGPATWGARRQPVNLRAFH